MTNTISTLKLINLIMYFKVEMILGCNGAIINHFKIIPLTDEKFILNLKESYFKFNNIRQDLY